MRIQIPLFALVVSLSSTVSSDTIVLTADLWCPYNCASQSKPGMIVEIATEILEAEGHEVTWLPAPYSRALKLVEEGKAEGVPGAYKSDAPGYIFHSTPFVQSTNVFHVRKGFKWRYQGAASLNGVRLGVVQDFTFGEPIDAYIAQHKDSENVVQIGGTDAISRLLTLLRKGRIDVVLEDRHVFDYWQSMTEPDMHVETAGELSSELTYVAFCPTKKVRSQKYADAIDKGIAAMKANGRFYRIAESYGLDVSL